MNRVILQLDVAIFTVIASTACSHKAVQTFAEAADPTPLTEQQTAEWDCMTDRLYGMWASPNIAYSRSYVPQNLTAECSVAGWRGEKVSAQLLLWSAVGAEGVECTISDFVCPATAQDDKYTLSSDIATARFVRYTLSDKADRSCLCGRPNGHPAILQADMLDNLERFDIAPKSVRPVWITINIPTDAVAGTYRATVKVDYCGWDSISLPLELKVADYTLAKPASWSYHLDLWQHPSAVARMEGVELWSDAHFEAMRPLMKMLADAGQKVITATLNRDPWRYQCFDDYEPMIYWTLHDDNRWEYDYTIFDKWVEFMMSLGIDKQINCYSMLPWGDCILDYKDMRTGQVQRNRMVSAVVGTPEFERMWAPFLTDFTAHLKQKGWFEITNMAIDERAPEDMDQAAALIAKYAPGLGFAIADNHNSYKRYSNMRDVCVGQRQAAMSFEEIAARRTRGDVSTYYVCCSTLFPNVFTNSQPYEAELLGLYAIAYDYDGMLRWAYNSWNANPQYDSRFRYWAGGDTFIVYPGARSSLRFERLIDGIELSEKVRHLRNVYGKDNPALEPLEALLAQVREANINDSSYDWQGLLDAVNQCVNNI